MTDHQFLSRDERTALARSLLVEQLRYIHDALPKLMGFCGMAGREDVRPKLRMAREWVAEALADVQPPHLFIVEPPVDPDDTQPDIPPVDEWDTRPMGAIE